LCLRLKLLLWSSLFLRETEVGGCGSEEVLEPVWGVLGKNPNNVFWFFMFWVLEVDFFKAGAGVSGSCATLAVLPFAILQLYDEVRVIKRVNTY
jgi:hypothetical protein